MFQCPGSALSLLKYNAAPTIGVDNVKPQDQTELQSLEEQA